MKISFAEIRNQLGGFSQKTKTGIYLHYPFCLSKCSYCHFYSLTGDIELHRRWLDTIKKEIRAASEKLSDLLVIDTIYFGGGTPSLLKPEEIREILERLRESFPAELTEVTLEANPDSCEKWLWGWREAGVNRLSVGAQSFDDEVLRILGRRHSAEKTWKFIRKARAAGFENINLDLIAGIPGETSDTVKTNLQALNELKPEHVSVYLLEELERVPFRGIWEKNPVSDEELVQRYQEYRQGLQQVGYKQYEISNFSQPGYRCQHNLKYWQYQPFLGFGPSAASHLGPVRWQNVAELKSWQMAVTFELLDVAEIIILNQEKSVAERLAFGLRLADGINWKKLKKEYPFFDFSEFEKKISELVSLGSLKFSKSHLRIPPEKFLIANSILAELIF